MSRMANNASRQVPQFNAQPTGFRNRSGASDGAGGGVMPQWFPYRVWPGQRAQPDGAPTRADRQPGARGIDIRGTDLHSNRGVEQQHAQEFRNVRKAPEMAKHSSFFDYRQSMITFFGRYKVWDVVNGSVQCPDPVRNPVEYAEWMDMDFFIRDSILQGVAKSDHRFINTMPTGQLMWTELINHKTKRDYTNGIYIFTDLMNNKFKAGGNVEKWIEKMEDLRRQLEDLGEGIPDEHYARILQACVAETHREVLRTFNAQYDVNGARPASRDVIRALRADTEVDDRVSKLCAYSGVTNESYQPEVHFAGKYNKGKYHGGNRGKKHKKNSNYKVSAGDDKCHKCGGVGHWKSECPSTDQKIGRNGGKANSNAGNPAFRRFQSGSSDDGKKEATNAVFFSHQVRIAIDSSAAENNSDIPNRQNGYQPSDEVHCPVDTRDLVDIIELALHTDWEHNTLTQKQGGDWLSWTQ